MRGIGRAVSAARAVDALELEQACIRVAINVIVMSFFAAGYAWDGAIDAGERVPLMLMGCALPWAFVLLGWILLRPGVNRTRRAAGMLVDMATITTLMLGDAQAGTLLFGFYLWVVIGNGFRFGRAYLHCAQSLALAGFTLVLLASDYWSEHRALGAGLFITLLAVPWYVSLLISRLNAANLRLQQARGEAEAANRAKSKFLAAASHDLRQPMQALSMYAAVLEERVGNAEALRVVHGVQLSVQALERLFDGLLDIAKIESGVIRPEVLAFPLMPLIERVVAEERQIAVRKNLKLRAVRTSALVRSDPVLLERMLKNLVTNAVRYTERGRIVVGCRRLGGGRLRLEVADSGIGIPLPEQARIFDEYYQVAGVSPQGLGLGLPIVKSLGELLGHAVAVRSEAGHGSIFSIELPAAAAGAAAAAEPRVRLPGIPRGASVALVDDDAEIRNSVRLLLETWGCRCIGGATAAEVKEKLRAQGVVPDALIVDYRLADAMTGGIL